MIYESQIFIPKDTPVNDVLDLFRYLGYTKTKRSKWIVASNHIASYYWFDETDYKSWGGVYCTVHGESNASFVLARTGSASSYWDLEFQNKTIREFKKKFGSKFVTNAGVNRFLHPIGKPPPPEQSGSYLAFERFKTNLIKARLYIKDRTFSDTWNDTNNISFVDQINPRLLSNNLLLPFLVSSMEDYFKSVFICLLKYSDKKETIIKSGRISTDQLLRISNNELTVEEAIAEMSSFQNINLICKHFKAINSTLDLEAELKRPSKRRKISLHESLEEIVARRHNFIHHAEMDTKFTDKDVLRALNDIQESATRFYGLLIKKYSWQPLKVYE